MARQRIWFLTKLHDRWDELRRRWRMTATVKARARDRCELHLLGVCTYWGKTFYEIVSPPQTLEDLVYSCPGCAE
jgi:hypothetical protein